MADGSRHSLYAVSEGAGKLNWGITPDTPAFTETRNTGVTLGLTKDSLQSEEIRSDRQIADFRLGSNQVGGDINFELSYGTFDTFLESALQGTWASDVLKVGTTRQSLSLLRLFDDLEAGSEKYFLYSGAEVNSMTLNFAANAMVTGSFSIVGKDQQIAVDAPTGATLGAPTVTSAMDSFTGAIEDGGQPIAVVTEATLTLENSIEARFVVGSKNTIYPQSGRSNLTGSITAYFENTALLKKFINEERSSLKLTCPDADGNTLEFLLPKIVYTGGQPDVSDEGSITLSMPFQAILDPTTETNFQITRIPHV